MFGKLICKQVGNCLSLILGVLSGLGSDPSLSCVLIYQHIWAHSILFTINVCIRGVALFYSFNTSWVYVLYIYFVVGFWLKWSRQKN